MTHSAKPRPVVAVCLVLLCLLAQTLSAQQPLTPSPSSARGEGSKDALLARTPRQVAEQLAAVYGHKLDQVAYIPSLPLVAKLRLSELTGDPKYAAEVDRTVGPF